MQEQIDWTPGRQEAFVARVRDLLVQRHLTHASLAHEAGVVPSAVSMWVSPGRSRARPLLHHVKAVAVALGVRVDWLLCDPSGGNEAPPVKVPSLVQKLLQVRNAFGSEFRPFWYGAQPIATLTIPSARVLAAWRPAALGTPYADRLDMQARRLVRLAIKPIRVLWLPPAPGWGLDTAEEAAVRAMLQGGPWTLCEAPRVSGLIECIEGLMRGTC